MKSGATGGPVRRRAPLSPGPQRIAVIGTTSSGKTTLASRLARTLGVPHVELDSLNWEPRWTAAPTKVFRRRVSEALTSDGWISDGNYSEVRDMVWNRATAIVWLDYPLWVNMRRLFWRTLRRVFTGEELWNGNRERFAAQFLSRESLFLWALKTYGPYRRRYAAMFADPAHAHLTLVRLRSPGEARRWLAGVKPG